ncbi:hypothetical protein [Butyrivibrio sp. AE3004]|nr:hypothetical protein [Butyrivibrio sp. AE3004]
MQNTEVQTIRFFPKKVHIAGLLRGILADMFYRFEDRRIILEPDNT